jgi:hypothetical protein
MKEVRSIKFRYHPLSQILPRNIRGKLRIASVNVTVSRTGLEIGSSEILHSVSQEEITGRGESLR